MRLLGLVLLALAFGASKTAAAPGVPGVAWRIRHHEGLSVQPVPADPEPGTRGPWSAAPRSLDFDAFGQRFELLLHPNASLIQDLPPSRRARIAHDLRAYRGSILGNPDSWVRLTEENGGWSGAIWDGQELYMLDPVDHVRHRLMDAPDDQARNVVYRLADVEGLEVRHCGLVEDGAADVPGGAYAYLEPLAAAVSPGSTLAIAAVADAEMVAAHGGEAPAAIVSRINVVDGIFAAQLGIALNIVEIVELQSNGPLTSTDASDLLYQFSQFSVSGAVLNPGHAHLFTGRDLDARTAGIAFVGGLCSSRLGVGLSEASGPGTAGALTVAHELGHNLGAPHDNQEGSPCATTPGDFLMNPRLNGSDIFSDCSVAQMGPTIAGASCLAPIAAAGDLDADGVPDGQDLCPFFADDQADTDGDGRGDACECGDQTGDGRVDMRDVLAISSVLNDAQEAQPLCDTDDDGRCNVLDILGVNAKIFGSETYCERYPPAAE